MQTTIANEQHRRLYYHLAEHIFCTVNGDARQSGGMRITLSLSFTHTRGLGIHKPWSP